MHEAHCTAKRMVSFTTSRGTSGSWIGQTRRVRRGDTTKRRRQESSVQNAALTMAAQRGQISEKSQGSAGSGSSVDKTGLAIPGRGSIFSRMLRGSVNHCSAIHRREYAVGRGGQGQR